MDSAKGKIFERFLQGRRYINSVFDSSMIKNKRHRIKELTLRNVYILRNMKKSQEWSNMIENPIPEVNIFSF